MSITCEDVTMVDAMKNKHHFRRKITKRNFKIVNPIKGFTKVDILPAVNMHCPEHFNCKDLIKLNRITVAIDGLKGQENIKDDFELIFKDNGRTHPNYNTRINYKLKSGSSSQYSFFLK